MTHIIKNFGGSILSETENIPCEISVKKQLTVLVAKKYGKIRGVFSDEVTEAVREHCIKLEKELEA